MKKCECGAPMRKITMPVATDKSGISNKDVYVCTSVMCGKEIVAK